MAQMPLQTELQAELSWRVELDKDKIPKCAVNKSVLQRHSSSHPFISASALAASLHKIK